MENFIRIKTKTKMKPTKKEALKWVNALRSGKYIQGKGALNPSEGHYCCLGSGL